MKTLIALACATAMMTLSPQQAVATTCSCAGVPILGAMQSASPNNKQWFLASTYEFHDLSDLVSGSSPIPDQTGRDRTSQALILEASKGLSEKWSFSALLSAVEHQRDVGGVNDTVSGLGDAIVMLKYSPRKISLYSKNALSFGVGARLPIGERTAHPRNASRWPRTCSHRRALTVVLPGRIRHTHLMRLRALAYIACSHIHTMATMTVTINSVTPQPRASA